MITIEQGQKIITNIQLFGLEDVGLPAIFSLLELADELYFNDDEDPILDDPDYDMIWKFAKASEPTNAYFLGIGSKVRGGKVNLPYQMGSLDQIHEGEILGWIQKWDLSKYKGVVSDKLDGASAMVVYDAKGCLQIAYSRGDGIQGADITRHMTEVRTCPKLINNSVSKSLAGKPLVVRGENIISVPNFQRAKTAVLRSNGKPYKNPRNMVSGMMNASSNPIPAYMFVDFIAYEIVGSELSKKEQLHLLDDLGFLVVSWEDWRFDNIDDDLMAAHIKTRKHRSPYELDGIVFDVESAEKRAAMNPTRSTLNPAYMFKYKITDESNVAYAICRDVEINLSKHGYLKPRISIEPVDLVGVTVSWATGFNMKFIRDHKIGPGATVKIARMGDVIPNVVAITRPMTTNNEQYEDWFNAKIAEYGETYWTETGVDLVLQNTSNNATVKYEQLVDFFNAVDAPHLGEGNLQKIFDMGFETPESVIQLTTEDLGSILNSIIMGKKIFVGLREKLTNIPLYKLMGSHPAFGRGVGVRKMKLLYDAFKGDMSLCESFSRIVDVPGFEEKTAIKIQNGYQPFLNFLAEVEGLISIAPYEAPKEGKFTGVAVVFTNFRDKSLESQIVNAGGKVGSAVSGKTGLVVTPDPNGSSGKLNKARELGIKIINIDELKGMLQ
jgi:DNA ligase (NAD+)